MINCDKSDKGKIQGVRTENEGMMGYVWGETS